MNFSTFIKRNHTHFVQQIQQQLASCTGFGHVEAPFARSTITDLQNFSTKGKLIRGLLIPYLVQVLQKTDSDTISDAVWYAATAIELAHSALLIHDDIIDNDEHRRGNPSMHTQLAKLPERHDKKYGESLAICTGDIAIFLAFELLQQSSSDPILLQKLTTLFSRELRIVGIGEMMDVQMSASSIIPSIADIEEMYRLKTARYTFSLPFTMGTVLAEITDTERLLPLFEQAGEHLGILFQIQDDEIGLTGTQEQTGKPIGSDIREGKKTIAWSALYTKATPSERSMLDQIAGKASADISEIQNVIQLYEQYDIQSVIKERTDYHTSKIHAIQDQIHPIIGRPVLSELITMLENRIK
ncbi:MAG: polyprenyl synthetase family protein [Patescibacteria group bacterium]